MKYIFTLFFLLIISCKSTRITDVDPLVATLDRQQLDALMKEIHLVLDEQVDNTSRKISINGLAPDIITVVYGTEDTDDLTCRETISVIEIENFYKRYPIKFCKSNNKEIASWQAINF